MKKRKSWMLGLFVLLLAGILWIPVQASAAETETTTVKNGWVTLKNGQIRYYADGKYYKNFHKIDGVRYYFKPENGYLKKNGFTKGVKDPTKRYYSSETGALCTSERRKIGGSYYYFKADSTAARNEWITLGGKQYYFGSNYKGAVGIRKVDGVFRVFSDKGVLCQKRGKYVQGDQVYFLNQNHALVFARVDGVFYNAKNQKVRESAAKSYDAFLFAYDRVQELTDSSMTAAEKLRVCFDYVAGTPYKVMRTEAYYDGWDADFANDIFRAGRGDCLSNACAVAYMFKALGYRDVYFCSNRTTNEDNHCWCELNGLVYDAWFAPQESRGGYAQNYAAQYSVFGQPAVLKIEILPDLDF